MYSTSYLGSDSKSVLFFLFVANILLDVPITLDIHIKKISLERKRGKRGANVAVSKCQ